MTENWTGSEDVSPAFEFTSITYKTADLGLESMPLDTPSQRHTWMISGGERSGPMVEYTVTMDENLSGSRRNHEN